MMLFVSKRGGKVTNIGESNKAKGVNKQHTHAHRLFPIAATHTNDNRFVRIFSPSKMEGTMRIEQTLHETRHCAPVRTRTLLRARWREGERERKRLDECEKERERTHTNTPVW